MKRENIEIFESALCTDGVNILLCFAVEIACGADADDLCRRIDPLDDFMRNFEIAHVIHRVGHDKIRFVHDLIVTDFPFVAAGKSGNEISPVLHVRQNAHPVVPHDKTVLFPVFADEPVFPVRTVNVVDNCLIAQNKHKIEVVFLRAFDERIQQEPLKSAFFRFKIQP